MIKNELKDGTTAEACTDEGRPISSRLLGKCPIHGLPRDVHTDCSRCRGEGVIEDDQDYDLSPPFIPCWQCNGTGTGIPDCEMCLIEYDDDA